MTIMTKYWYFRFDDVNKMQGSLCVRPANERLRYTVKTMIFPCLKLTLLITCGDQINPVQHCKFYGCCWPGSLGRQDISSHDIAYVE